MLEVLPNNISGNVGVPVNAKLFAIGGLAPYTWSLAAGSLPPGTMLDTRGALTGTPTQQGNYAFTLQVVDSGPPQQTAQGMNDMSVANQVVILPAQVPLGVITRGYSFSSTAVGGTPPYTWSITFGSLPPGLSLDTTSGLISGTPTQAGTFQMDIQANDSAVPSQQGAAFLAININPLLSIAPTTIGDAVQNVLYNQQIFCVGGLPPYTATVSGALPPGINFIPPSGFDNIGNIMGTATQLGTSNFTVFVSDSETPMMTASQNLSLRVNPRLVLNPPGPLPVGLQGQPYSFQFTATGGLPPLMWGVGFIQLPQGMSLDPSSGLLSGTPTTGINDVGRFVVGDSSRPPQSAFVDAQLTIAEILRITTTTLPPVALDVPLQISLANAGGIGPFTWSLLSGSLPTGLTFDPSTVTIKGTPTIPGTSMFTLQVNDPGPPAQTARVTLNLAVKSFLGRNDSIATATPLSNGTYQASVSPASDPSSTGPDVDIYQLSADPGAVVAVETFAQRLNPPSPLDTVIDIVDTTGTQLNTCAPSLFAGAQFPDLCVNNSDLGAITTDSRLFFQAPPGATGPVTFYVRVYDFKGGARPDYIYTLTISGAN